MTYYDNCFLKAGPEEDLSEKAAESIKLFAQAGMNLRQFISNNPTALKNLNLDSLAKDQKIAKVLGLVWNTVVDTLTINFPQPAEPPLTKRKVLRTMASCFDPLGLVSPVVLPLKELYQRSWSRAEKWDQPVLLTDKITFEEATRVGDTRKSSCLVLRLIHMSWELMKCTALLMLQ
uniref:Uncharacterized protein n=1 Tax=Ditylenchus dipsaci TaxID=166011 RepID=A0A915D5F5_9BILA